VSTTPSGHLCKTDAPPEDFDGAHCNIGSQMHFQPAYPTLAYLSWFAYVKDLKCKLKIASISSSRALFKFDPFVQAFLIACNSGDCNCVPPLLLLGGHKPHFLHDSP